MKVIDQLNRTIDFNFPPKRIISLVPSQSELLWDLGLQHQLVGITKFCVHPEDMFRSVKRVGGTKTIKLNEITKLNPDLIIANKEENQQEQIEELCKHYHVYISNIFTIEDALNMIKDVGLITDRKEKAKKLVDAITIKYHSFKTHHLKPRTLKRVAYFIWYKPYMAAGSVNFINHMLSVCRLENVFAHHNNRYPEISIEELQQQNPNVVFLSSEPFPFKEKHIKELQTHLPKANIVLVDGEMFSWYGSRLLYAFDYFKGLIPTLL